MQKDSGPGHGLLHRFPICIDSRAAAPVKPEGSCGGANPELMKEGGAEWRAWLARWCVEVEVQFRSPRPGNSCTSSYGAITHLTLSRTRESNARCKAASALIIMKNPGPARPLAAKFVLQFAHISKGSPRICLAMQLRCWTTSAKRQKHDKNLPSLPIKRTEGNGQGRINGSD